MKAVDLTPDLVADFLSRPVRPADEEEWQDGLGRSVQEALPGMVDWTAYNRAIVLDSGECVVLFGCHVLPEGWGVLWLVASSFDLALAPLVHRTMAHDEWPQIMDLAPNLVAFPSSKNTAHHRWLEHFGFQREGEVAMGANNVPFIRYVRRAHVL